MTADLQRARRERAATLLEALPHPPGYAAGILGRAATRIRSGASDEMSDHVGSARALVNAVARTVTTDAERDAAATARDALGLLWAVLS